MSFPALPGGSDAIAVAHDPDVALLLGERVRWLMQNQDVTSHELADQIQTMWRGWTPVLDDPCGMVDPEFSARLWAFRHNEQGWAVTYLPRADRLWEDNQQRAVAIAYQFSASAPTLLSLCERLYANGFSAARRAGVEHVLSCPDIDPACDRGRTRMLLALRVPPPAPSQTPAPRS